MSSREMEIRRKIAKLKREGRIGGNKDPLADELDGGDDEDEDTTGGIDNAYRSKIRDKLGDVKSKMLGYGSDGEDENIGDAAGEDGKTLQQRRRPQIGSLPVQQEDRNSSTESASMDGRSISGKDRKPIIDPSLFGDDDKEDDNTNSDDLSEEELVDLVAQKMIEKRDRERREKDALMKQQAREKLAELERERQPQEDEELRAPGQSDSSQSKKQLTSGIGGSWSKNGTATQDVYQPKSGSWGAFPRPRDISKAYGGGRRIGPGYSNEEARLKSEEDTRERLQRYREKVGIEVPAEKENAALIDEALNIGMLAMQRGMYSTAVSALEKVTKYCSTNSKVGGKVFLELAMAYEAVGKTSEAITVYTALSKSRIEDIKFNAKRLLYGLEAMQFMRDDMKSSSFSRKNIKNTFIDTTGLANIASNFDDVYQTAYIDLEGNTYKKLTESVVRSAREARQILLRATGAGEITRTKVVQALRSLSRRFDDALVDEMAELREPVAFLDGKPIVSKDPRRDNYGSISASSLNVAEEFVLADAQTMRANLAGEWRLQLLADKRGDGYVKTHPS